MKTITIYAAILLSIFSFNSFAQNVKKETIKVWGNCSSCKKHIEKSAKAAGASFASWNEETKNLQVSYNPAKSNAEKIQKSIAASGYDTRDFKGDDKAYTKLDACCQYDRK